jgi:phasin family protein
MFMIDAAKGLFKAEGESGLIPSPRPVAPKGFIMTPEEMQKFSKDSMETAMSSLGAWSKSAQAIVTEVTDYSKKTAEGSAAAWEKLLGAKTMEKAMEVQSEFLKSSYSDFVAEATKLGELYADLAKEAYKPFEGALAKVSMK